MPSKLFTLKLRNKLLVLCIIYTIIIMIASSTFATWIFQTASEDNQFSVHNLENFDEMLRPEVGVGQQGNLSVSHDCQTMATERDSNGLDTGNSNPDYVEKYPGFSCHVDFHQEILDSLDGGPMDYIPYYKNPCWYSKMPSEATGSNPYEYNPYNQDPTANLQKARRIMSKKREQGHLVKTRCLPLIYLIGVTAAGSNDIYDDIIMHSDIAKPAMKEPMWWNRYTIGRNKRAVTFSDYLDLFDSAADAIEEIASPSSEHLLLTVEGSSTYLWNYDGWEEISGNRGLSEPKYILAHAIRELVPKAKIVVILRHPTERLFLHFKKILPTASSQEFHERVIQAVETFNQCLQNHTLRHCAYKGSDWYERGELFLRASLYSVYLEDWLKVFPREQLLVLRTEDYYHNRRATLEQVFSFVKLGFLSETVWDKILTSTVENSEEAYDGTRDGEMYNATRMILNNFFRPYNNHLAHLLNDQKYLWNS